MSIDLNKVLTSAQETIDKAVEAITETQKTQQLVTEDMRLADTKISEHNNSTKDSIHPDIREALSAIPVSIKAPIITGPNAVVSGIEHTWHFVAESAISGMTVANAFIVTLENGDSETLTPKNSEVDWTHTFNTSEEVETYFKVQATGTNSCISKITTFKLNVNLGTAPAISNLTHNIPSIIASGNTYTFEIDGTITDVDNNLDHLSLVCSDSAIALPDEVATNFQLGKTYQFQVPDGHTGADENTKVIFTVTAHDANKLFTSESITTHLNAAPNVDKVTHTFKKYPAANHSYQATVRGAVDPEGKNVTYDITSDNDKITFGKSKDIALGEEITVNFGDLAENTAYTLTLRFKDDLGDTTEYTYSDIINTPPDVSGLTAVFDKERYIAPDSGTVVISGATDTFNNSSLVYSIQDDSSGITWDKTESIAEGESVGFTISETAIRGTRTIKIGVYDGSTTVTKDFVLRLNQLPVATDVTTTLPQYVVPGSRNSFIVQGATDVDTDDTLKYTITSDNADAVIENGTDVATGSVVYITVPTEDKLARGSTLSIKIKVSDGYESAFTTASTIINSLPTSDTITLSLPTSVTSTDGTSTVTMKVSGGTVTSGTATYELSNADNLVTFSKTTGIAANDTITCTFAKVATATNTNITVKIKDQLNEYSSTDKDSSVTINPFVVVKPVTISSPAENATIDTMSGATQANFASTKGFTMTWGNAIKSSYMGSTAYSDFKATNSNITTDFSNDSSLV